ncbi:hypothetical protein [Bowmanella yangjiangensis]|uniref:Type II secretion system protein K n=1 Tax=Bowmanella yangjiangensis TaxID=2811230 RepID=A0ABS3CWB8_9ALTE|nr:hypothetical protein [Bowmanella yangjiangensis]MBN7820441.1 hypothetical protein [Bowmanella yangjiangensis]
MMVRDRQQGAALLAVLIVSVVLVTLLGASSVLLNSRLQIAEASKARMAADAKAYAKINQLIYLLSTQRRTVAGVSQGIATKTAQTNEDGLYLQPIAGDELRTDGFLYQEQDIEFSIQNEDGLLPINSSFQYWLKLWLKNTGYSLSEQSYFADRLADYADGDDWQRPAGAEKATYLLQDKMLPMNFLLQQCSELAQVSMWDALVTNHPQILAHCSLRRSPRLNINAIPISLWQKLWPGSVQRLTEARARGRWLITYQDSYLIEPALALIPEEYYSPLGGERYILSVTAKGNTQKISVEIGEKNNRPFTRRTIY